MRTAGSPVRFAAAVILVASLSTTFVEAQDPSSDPGHLSAEAVYPVLIQAMQDGNLTRARVICEKTIAWEPRNFIHRYNLACIESREGGVHLKRAISSLKEAIAIGFSDTAQLQNDPDLAAVRAEPEFAAILVAAGRNAGARTPVPQAPRTPAVVPVANEVRAAVTEPPATATPAKQAALPPLAPKSGHIIGRVIAADGSPLPNVTLQYSGFEDGKLARSTYAGNLIETIDASATAKNGRYEIKVPAGAYRISAYATYNYEGRTYQFELEQINPPETHDFPSLRLDKLGRGLVRDFVLHLNGRRAHSFEETESGFRNAYFGRTVEFEANQITGVLGGGNTFTKALAEAYPPESILEITFVPAGPFIDGSSGAPVTATFPLSQAFGWRFVQRGLYPGKYNATARVTTPDGRTRPIKVSLERARTVPAPDGKNDALVMDWSSSVLLGCEPSDLGLKPHFGVKTTTLYLGP
ncbi:MAG: hypothetical protein ABIZ04_11905 [Opitutus sp.]